MQNFKNIITSSFLFFNKPSIVENILEFIFQWNMLHAQNANNVYVTHETLFKGPNGRPLKGQIYWREKMQITLINFELVAFYPFQLQKQVKITQEQYKTLK